jgi:type I restriction enzyme S subunit
MPDSNVGPYKLTAKDVVDGRIAYESARRTTWNAYHTLLTRKSRPSKGDILLTKDGSIGRVAIVDRDDVCINQSVAVMRPHQDTDTRFLAYLLRAPHYQQRMAADADGSTIQHIYITRVDKMLVAVPSFLEQRAIAAVLGALDDKIELNRRSGRTLEGLARAMFQAWFMDFEPVKAKAAGAVGFPGMAAAAFAVLPDQLTDSKVGPVPRGWAVRPLTEVFDVNPPRRLAKGQDAPYLDMKNMPTNGHAPDTWERRPHGSGMRFMNGDTLVARITPCLENGKTAFVDFLNDGEVGWGSTEYLVLRPKPPLPEIFAYCLARTSEFRDFAIQNMTGTSGRQRVAAAALEHYHVAVPDAVTAAAFGEVARPLFECVRGGKTESAKLAVLRDYLLPRLLSGNVRVESNGAS